MKRRYSHLIMLGTACDTRGGISAVVNSYKANGLFERWPISYVATHRDGGVAIKLYTLARAFLQVLFILVRERRVIMHIHGASRASFWRKSIFMALAMVARCPVIFHLHGGGFAHFVEHECNTIGRSLARFLLSRCERIIVLSQTWQDWASRTLGTKNIICIGNPIPDYLPRYPLRRETSVFFCGRLERSKGIFDLLAAVAQVRKTVPGVTLVCAGEGDTAAVAQCAAELGITDAVKLHGWVDAAKKRSLLSCARVFALPSYAEGLPMSVLEAMASGLPVGATPVGGMGEMIEEGVSGYFVNPGDVRALANKLTHLLDNPAIAAQFGRAGKRSVEAKYCSRRIVGEVEDLYRGLGLAPLVATAGTPAFSNIHHAGEAT